MKLSKTLSNHPVPFWHPASLIATFFGIGLIPIMPGTFGSLATFPLFWLIMKLLPMASFVTYTSSLATKLWYVMGILMLIWAIITALGVWAAHYFVVTSKTEDPGSIVIDEVSGQFLTIIGILPLTVMLSHHLWFLPAALFASFLLFRLCDILKPWPIGWADRTIKGGLGVMVDDIIAGIMASVLFYAFFFIAIDIAGWNPAP